MMLGLMKKRVLPLPEPPMTSTFLFRAFFGIRRTAAHGQALRLGQDDVVPRVSVHERRNVAWLSP